ncbi:MAG: HD domain-containing phosphohydrolase [Planctomycetota bacterium]
MELNPNHPSHRVTRALTVVGSLSAILFAATVASRPSLTTMGLALLAAPMVVLAWRALRREGRLHERMRAQAQAAVEAENHYFEVLSEVMAVVEGRDRYLAGRSGRIAALTNQMAVAVGLDASEAALLGRIARVHDIGLLSVEPEVLRKATGLTGAEYGAVKKHCQVGCHMLRPLTFLRPMLDAVLYHHERMNGTGYPEGLTGEQIPLPARILAVADSYEAMTHDRPHRHSLTSRQAVGELIRCADVGYDRRCVKALAEIAHAEDLLPASWRDAAAEPAAQPALMPA